MLKGIYLTLLMGPVVPVPAPRPVIEALTSAQVTTAAGQASGFQLSFTVSKQSLLNRVLLPAGFFDPNIRVILVVTMNGMPTVLMDGVIARQDLVPSNEPGQSTLTITGEDLTLVMDLKDETACYPGLSADKRVTKICLQYAKYGIVPLIVPPMRVDIPDPTRNVPVQTATDLRYIRSLAEKTGYVFYVDPGPAPGQNVAYWGPEIRIGIPQPALSVNLDAATNVESLTFGYDGQAKKRYTVTVTEPNTKFPIAIPIPEVGLLRPPLAARPAAALREGPLPNTAKSNPIEAALLGLASTAQASDAISGSGRLDVLRYGHILKARQLVSVRGAGLAYDGFYYVKSVTHNLGRGEYKQSFTLGRDGLLPLTPKVRT